ncbi:MAG TPA: penicillin-binding protein 2 [Gaiellaceae bacterium]|nr:penicillin-binding protein 2 [Gaiellaceae bacterium]
MASTTGRPALPLSRRPRAEEPEAEHAEQQTVVEPYRLTPKLSRRVTLLGAVVVIGFVALFGRLWALQVLAGPQYAARAQANQLRTVRVAAPRGPIVDRNGNVLVTNRPVTAIELWPSGLPKVYARRVAELRELAHIARVNVRQVTRLIVARRKAGDMLDPIVVRPAAPGPMLTYLQERASDFPGLTLAQSYVRRYPHGPLATQLLGYVGQISQPQLKTMGKEGYAPGDEIGQTGIESAFNTYLFGVPGAARVRVDSLGRPRSNRTLTTQPQPGQTVRLTLDTGLQLAAQNALQYGIQLAHNNNQWAADGGAIVALSPKDGSVLALASSPTYDPSVYTGRITQRRLAAQGLTTTSALKRNYPSIDRALDGTYPPGSTFKPLTAIAALQEHLIKPYAFYPCTGTYKAPEDRSHRVWHNWDRFVDQGMDLPTALARSCDTYFYGVGNSFFELPTDRGQPIQKWARAFGFGKASTTDMGSEAPGTLPTIAYKHHRFTKTTDPTNWRIDRLWKPGDSIQLAIGQGDLLVTPLQMARFYAAIANGGKLVTPHVLMDVENPNHTPVPTAAPPAPRPIPGLDPNYLKVVQQGLFQGTHDSLGTSYGVFGNFPVPVAGKTGTAQKVVQLPGYHGEQDQSWWCGYGPANEPKVAPQIVVCAVIENGGEGGAAAAPAAEKVFAKFFNVPATQVGYIHSD